MHDADSPDQQMIVCPRCKAYLDVFPEMFGSFAQCEGCKHIFTVEESLVLPQVDGKPVRVARAYAARDLPHRPARAQRYRDSVPAEDGARSDDDLPADIRPGSGYGVTSLVIGLCAVILGVGAWFICCPFVQTLPGVVAIIFGYMGLKTEGRGMSIAGMILGAIAALLSLLPIILFGAFFGTVGKKPAPAPPPAVATPNMGTTALPPKNVPNKIR
jgi:hypothetical protein